MAEHDEARESIAGRLWLGCVATATLVVPLWFMLTAIIIQLSPELSGFDMVIDGGGEVRRVPVIRAWFWGGMLAAVLLTVILPLLGTMLGVFRAGAFWSQRREDAERLRYDAMVRDEAVLRDPRWQEPADDTDSYEAMGGAADAALDPLEEPDPIDAPEADEAARIADIERDEPLSDDLPRDPTDEPPASSAL